MKNLFILFFVVLAGCGGGLAQNNDPLANGESGEPAHEAPKQPFVFEEVGDYLHGLMPIDIETLPSGNFVVATRDGHVIVLNPELKSIGHSSVPTNTYFDSGLFSIVVLGQKLYAGLTLDESLCPNPDVFCNGIMAFDFDETQNQPLSNPSVIFYVDSVDREGQHNGGAMVADEDGNLLYGTGNGYYQDDEEEPIKPDLSQEDSSMLGKIIRVDPTGVDQPEVVAKGLRNPFTAARVPGLGMLIGDVGSAIFEEMNFLPFGMGGLNYGWPLEEGPVEGSPFTQPIIALDHCDIFFQDQDPFGHDIPQSMAIKNHAGVEHTCGFTTITAAGFYDGQGDDPYSGKLDRTAIYSQAYYGYIRGVTLDGDGRPSNDRHLAHFPGLAATTTGLDGYIYGVSIFGSNFVLKMLPNPEIAE
jgi:hypothetical protein